MSYFDLKIQRVLLVLGKVINKQQQMDNLEVL